MITLIVVGDAHVAEQWVVISKVTRVTFAFCYFIKQTALKRSQRMQELIKMK